MYRSAVSAVVLLKPFFCEFSIQRRSELLFRRLVKTVDILDAYLLAGLIFGGVWKTAARCYSRILPSQRDAGATRETRPLKEQITSSHSLVTDFQLPQGEAQHICLLLDLLIHRATA